MGLKSGFLGMVGAVAVLLLAAAPSRANVTFTAQRVISEKYSRDTVTLGIQSCAFDETMVAEVGILGLPFGIPGTDPAINVDAGPQGCHLYATYLVTTLDTKENTGQHIVVQRNEGPRNVPGFDDQAHWFLAVPNQGEDTHSFDGIWSHFLFVDEGCCPGPSGLEVWDLDKKANVFTTTCADPSLDDGILTYWVEEYPTANHRECPDKEVWTGSGPAIERRMELDLSTLGVSKTAETRCAPRP